MDTIRQILESYFAGNPIFLTLHLTVAFCAIWLAFQFRRSFESLKHRADSVQRMTAEDMERFTFSLKKFDHQFDLCASIFIFIGLIGTIAGFAQSLSKKS